MKEKPNEICYVCLYNYLNIVQGLEKDSEIRYLLSHNLLNLGKKIARKFLSPTRD